jgi:hypothetical protein
VSAVEDAIQHACPTVAAIARKSGIVSRVQRLKRNANSGKGLIDGSHRSSLIDFRPFKTGRMSSAGPDRLRDLLAGENFF